MIRFYRLIPNRPGQFGQLICIDNQYFNKKEPLAGLKIFREKCVNRYPLQNKGHQKAQFQPLEELKWNEDHGAFEIWSTGNVASCDQAAVLFAYGTIGMGILCGSVLITIFIATVCKALFFGAREITT